MEGGGSGMPDTTVEPFGGVVGLIQQTTGDRSCPLENASEILTKASLLLLLSIGTMFLVQRVVIILRLGWV